jgi:preprotein translocase subunit SecD
MEPFVRTVRHAGVKRVDEEVEPEVVPTGSGPFASSDLTSLYHRQRASMVRLARLLTGSTAIAEEVVQESFLKMHQLRQASPATPAVLHQVATVLSNRFRGLGVSGVSACVVGHDVTISGRATEDARARDLAVVGQTEVVSLRPVECGAPPYSAATSGAPPTTSSPLPPCGAQYETNQANLAVTPDHSTPGGYTDRTVPPDPAFTAYPSTPPSLADFGDSSTTVLLPTAPGAGAEEYGRYVLGPSELTGADITGARVVKDGGHWAVDLTFTSAARARWAAFVDENFHQMIGIDLDGAVLAAPLIQPSQAAVSSPGREFQLTGASTGRQAHAISSVFGRDSMPVPLVRVSQTIVGAGLVDGAHR